MRHFALLAAMGIGAAAPIHAAGPKLVSQRTQIIEATGCFARVAPAMSENILAMEPGKARSRKAEQLMEGRWSCVPDGKMAISVRHDMFYGELAGALLLRSPDKIDAIARRPASRAMRPATGLSDGEFVYAYSECLLLAEPQKTAAVLRASRGTPEERTAVIAFGQTLSDCMPTDISYTMNIPDLRAHLAYQAYRSLLPAGDASDA